MNNSKINQVSSIHNRLRIMSVSLRGWSLIQFEKKSQDAHANIVFFTSETLFPLREGRVIQGGRFGSEICQAKWGSWSLSFPLLFSLMIFWFTTFKSCNSHSSASGWTVETSQWLYASAELCASFQAVC